MLFGKTKHGFGVKYESNGLKTSFSEGENSAKMSNLAREMLLKSSQQRPQARVIFLRKKGIVYLFFRNAFGAKGSDQEQTSAHDKRRSQARIEYFDKCI